MDIGIKIKNARIKANLTQEQVAEFLGVSRQTISNWETEKTFPDIVSVVKLSDLYHVSLDHLLKEVKEEKPMSNYLDYLEESTNIVKSRNRFAKLILITTYLVIWAISLIVFWVFVFTSDSDAMGYSVMFLWILLPVTTFIVSLVIGKNGYWGKYKWLSAVIFGFMHMLAGYVTFSLANMVTFNKVNMPDFSMIVIGAMISGIGIGTGVGINRLKARFASRSN